MPQVIEQPPPIDVRQILAEEQAVADAQDRQRFAEMLAVLRDPRSPHEYVRGVLTDLRGEFGMTEVQIAGLCKSLATLAAADAAAAEADQLDNLFVKKNRELAEARAAEESRRAAAEEEMKRIAGEMHKARSLRDRKRDEVTAAQRVTEICPWLSDSSFPPPFTAAGKRYWLQRYRETRAAYHALRAGDPRTAAVEREKNRLAEILEAAGVEWTE